MDPERFKRWRDRGIKAGVWLALFLVGICLIPHRWCSCGSDAWFHGDAARQQKLAHEVERWITTELTRRDFHTGHPLFNGEWLFGTYMMAGMGFGQAALEHPEWRARHTELMGLCIERILSPEVRAFDREIWGDDPIESLATDSDHAAFLGYFNLLLSFHRLLDSSSKYAELSDRVTDALVRRVERSPTLLLQTYPDEVYPVDNCAVVGSIGLYDRATKADHAALLSRWTQRCRETYVDQETGLLYQAVRPDTGTPLDHPRGSGTCLGLYFLSFCDPSLAEDLYRATRRELAGNFLGFGVVREYPITIHDGRADIDSGPIVLGYGISATGFSLAASRVHGDAAQFARLCSTVHLFGAPFERGSRGGYVMGGPLGNAILFAMLTAQPAARSWTAPKDGQSATTPQRRS